MCRTSRKLLALARVGGTPPPSGCKPIPTCREVRPPPPPRRASKLAQIEKKTAPNQAGDGVEGDGNDDAQSVDSMKLESSGASAAVSSSSSSDDGLGRTPQKKKRKRMPQEEAPKPEVPRSLFQSMSHDVVREAKRRISKEQDQLSWCENA